MYLTGVDGCMTAKLIAVYLYDCVGTSIYMSVCLLPL